MTFMHWIGTFIRRMPADKSKLPDDILVNGALLKWFHDRKGRLHYRIWNGRVKLLTREPAPETLDGIEP